MDFSSLKNNPLYGPLRLIVVFALTRAIAKGWVPADVIDPDLLTGIIVGLLATWSLWQQSHTAKKADLVTAVAVHSAVARQTPVMTPLSQAEQKAVVAGAKAAVERLPEKEITDRLNQSQTGEQP